MLSRAGGTARARALPATFKPWLDDPRSARPGAAGAGGLRRSRHARGHPAAICASIPPAEREDAIATLAARPAWAHGVARGPRARPDSPARRERFHRPAVAGIRRPAPRPSSSRRSGARSSRLPKPRPVSWPNTSRCSPRTRNSRPTCRAGGPSSTAPAWRATGFMTPAATSDPT